MDNIGFVREVLENGLNQVELVNIVNTSNYEQDTHTHYLVTGEDNFGNWFTEQVDKLVDNRIDPTNQHDPYLLQIIRNVYWRTGVVRQVLKYLLRPSYLNDREFMELVYQIQEFTRIRGIIENFTFPKTIHTEWVQPQADGHKNYCIINGFKVNCLFDMELDQSYTDFHAKQSYIEDKIKGNHTRSVRGENVYTPQSVKRMSTSVPHSYVTIPSILTRLNRVVNAAQLKSLVAETVKKRLNVTGVVIGTYGSLKKYPIGTDMMKDMPDKFILHNVHNVAEAEDFKVAVEVLHYNFEYKRFESSTIFYG